MGLRGPKPKSKNRADVARSLAQLDPIAMQVVDGHLRGTEEADKVRLDNAWNVIWMNHGKPRQQVALGSDVNEPLRVLIERVTDASSNK